MFINEPLAKPKIAVFQQIFELFIASGPITGWEGKEFRGNGEFDSLYFRKQLIIGGVAGVED